MRAPLTGAMAANTPLRIMRRWWLARSWSAGPWSRCWWRRRFPRRARRRRSRPAPRWRLLRDRMVVPLMNKASMQRRVWENLSQLKVTYRNGPLGGQARKWFSGRGPLPGDRVPDIECVRAEGGGHTTLHAELGDKWALVMPGPMVSDEYAAVVAKRLGDHPRDPLGSGARGRYAARSADLTRTAPDLTGPGRTRKTASDR